jgi:hypothetical protein
MVEVKSVIQRVFEYVSAAGRAVSAREVITSLPDASRSAITFALTRLTRDGDIRRSAVGRYCIPDERELPQFDPIEDDAYLNRLFEAIRPALSFPDLAFLYEVVQASRRLTPEVFQTARRRTKSDPTDG